MGVDRTTELLARDVESGIGFQVAGALRQPTPADLAAHVAALPRKKQVAARDAIAGTCEWSRDDEDSDSGVWVSACGAAWEFLDGGPTENGMRYCPKCGAVAEVPHGR